MTNRMISNGPRRCAHREMESFTSVFGLSKICDVCKSRLWNLFDMAKCTGKFFARVNSSTIDNLTPRGREENHVLVRFSSDPLPPVYFMRGERKPVLFDPCLFNADTHTPTHAKNF